MKYNSIIFIRMLTAFFISYLFVSCSSNKTASNTTAMQSDGWVELFDGKTPGQWRAFNGTTFPSGWVIENGTLKGLGQAHGDTGGDIVFGGDTYENFDLMFDWKISAQGNSGIFYHVLEGAQYKAPYATGPEYQMIDDNNFPEKLEEWQKTGADYAMYTAPATKKLKPAGEWNTGRIRVTPAKVTYWLNGEETVSFEPYNAEWLARRNSGKWNAFPDYAKSRTGLIALQDHGSPVWFKNIKIKKL